MSDQISSVDVVDTLRRAATEMRKTAGAAGGPLHWDAMRHIVAWPPAMAIAVAEWLDAAAAAIKVGGDAVADFDVPFVLTDLGKASLAVACTFLAESGGSR